MTGGFAISGCVLVGVAGLFPAGPPATTTLVFQDGLGGYAGTVDTHIRQSDPAASFGLQETFVWDTDDPPGTLADTFALLRFDDIIGNGVGQIPPGAGIVSARLVYEVLGGVGNAHAREVLADWDESTTYDTFGPAPGVQGADRRSEILATAWVTGTTINLWDLNVRQSLVRWVDDPAANRGWVFQAAGPTTLAEVVSSEYTLAPPLRPRLVVVVNNTSDPTLVRGPFLQQATPTSIKIAWRTDLASDSRVLTGPGPLDLSTETLDPQLATDHVVTVTGLVPGQQVFYAIGSSTVQLAGGDDSYFFRTPPLPADSSPVTIWAIGDSGRSNADQFAVRDAMLAALGGTAPDVMLHLGDLAYNFCTDGELTDHLLGMYEQTLRHSPLWTTVGTHEGFNNDIAAQTGPYYRTFSFPTNAESGGTPSGTESYYSFDHGTVHFVCIAGIGVEVLPDAPMLLWLEADLAATDAEWVIAFFNHGPYSKGGHDSDSDPQMRAMREVVLPVLEAHGVDLVLGGHSHNYQRSYLVDGAYDTPTTADGHIVDPGDGRPDGDGAYCKSPGMNARQGAVYVIAGHGAGGAQPGNHVLMGFQDNEAGSCLVQIADGALSFQNVTFDGTVADHFTIIKNLAGDVDGDCTVGINDFLLLLANWGPCGACADCPADLDGDCTVGINDFLALLGNWS